MNLDSSRRGKIRPLRDRMRVAVAEAILDAAEEVFAERGLHDAAMNDVAARAGVAVGTVYNYFDDRDGLVRALLRARRDVIGPAITRAAAAHAGPPFAVALRGFLTDVLGVLEQHRRFVRIALENEHLRPEPAGAARPVTTSLRGAARELIEAGRAEGALRAGETEPLVRLLLGAMRGLLLLRVEQGGAFTDDADLLAEVFLRGVEQRPRR